MFLLPLGGFAIRGETGRLLEKMYAVVLFFMYYTFPAVVLFVMYGSVIHVTFRTIKDTSGGKSHDFRFPSRGFKHVLPVCGSGSVTCHFLSHGSGAVIHVTFRSIKDTSGGSGGKSCDLIFCFCSSVSWSFQSRVLCSVKHTSGGSRGLVMWAGHPLQYFRFIFSHASPCHRKVPHMMPLRDVRPSVCLSVGGAPSQAF